MKITRRMIAQIQTALSEKKMPQAELAKRIGFHRSHISKLLKGELESMSDELLDGINDVLGLDLAPIPYKDGDVSQLALRVSQLAENDERFSTLLETLCNMATTTKLEAFLPQVHQKQLIKIGAELTRIVHEWEDGNDPHYAKIGSESLTFLRKFYGKIQGEKLS